MSTGTSIEWTDATWNPVTGCSKISPGCKNCYAERMAARLKAMGVQRYSQGFDVAMHPDALGIPLRWRKPRRVFVNSMSDLFHDDVPFEFICRVFETMRQATRHKFQVLTKRPKRMLDVSHWLPWPVHIWAGVSVESSRFVERIDRLRRVPAAVRFLSLEPLLEPLGDLDLSGIDWVIVGGESGPGARPMQTEWVRDIRTQCAMQSVPFFFKQWGGTNKCKTGRVLDGKTWDGMPEPRSENPRWP
ncbi:MAG: phage Gp37/Gp68 family protein [Gammaproteobacteria bacterium]|nr:phage Gp37/Gp68 family protein [Gammaproteobacteria bacterium]